MHRTLACLLALSLTQGNKTTATLEYLDGKEFLILACNKAIALNTHARGMADVTCYLDLKKEEKLAGIEARRLIICMNSLFYLKKRDYKVVVFDEIETILLKVS